ncbi:unnamed protein product [Closterium sp. Yama58-4]|nr:unnamed protein product [Closterium sp. Yama58-4]
MYQEVSSRPSRSRVLNHGRGVRLRTTRNAAGNDASENAKSGLADGTAGSSAAETRVVGSAGPEAQLGSAAAVESNGVAGGRRRRKKQPNSDKPANAESRAGRETSIESANNGRRGSTASDVNQRLTFNAASQPLDDSITASQPLDVSDPRVWLPPPPDVPRPRATHNAAMLAYIGDGIYELYARRHFLNPPSAIATYCQRVTAVVCCEAQDALLRRLTSSKMLTEEERDVVRWGGNASTGARKAKGRAGSTVYANATALETLIGFLYLTNPPRLEELITATSAGPRQHRTASLISSASCAASSALEGPSPWNKASAEYSVPRFHFSAPPPFSASSASPLPPFGSAASSSAPARLAFFRSASATSAVPRTAPESFAFAAAGFHSSAAFANGAAVGGASGASTSDESTSQNAASESVLSDAPLTSGADVSGAVLGDGAADVISAATSDVGVTVGSELAAAAAHCSAPIAALQQLIGAVHDVAGLPWWLSIAAATVGIRLILLPAFVYQVRSTVKMAPEMERLLNKVKAAVSRSAPLFLPSLLPSSCSILSSSHLSISRLLFSLLLPHRCPFSAVNLQIALVRLSPTPGAPNNSFVV